MTRLRTSLVFLALAALVVSAAPAFAGAAPVVNPVLANQCAAPAASTAIGTPAPTLKIFPPPDFILCDCKYCERHPDDICQISPSGFSIVCSDWYRTHC